jgi:hypothetical protein
VAATNASAARRAAGLDGPGFVLHGSGAVPVPSLPNARANRATPGLAFAATGAARVMPLVPATGPATVVSAAVRGDFSIASPTSTRGELPAVVVAGTFSYDGFQACRAKGVPGAVDAFADVAIGGLSIRNIALAGGVYCGAASGDRVLSLAGGLVRLSTRPTLESHRTPTRL